MGFNKVQIFFTQDLAQQKKQTDSLTVEYSGMFGFSFWVVILDETWIISNLFLWIIESSRSKLAQLHWRFDSSREIWWKPPGRIKSYSQINDLGCSPTNSTKLRFPLALSGGDWICREAPSQFRGHALGSRNNVASWRRSNESLGVSAKIGEWSWEGRGVNYLQDHPRYQVVGNPPHL